MSKFVNALLEDLKKTSKYLKEDYKKYKREMRMLYI